MYAIMPDIPIIKDVAELPPQIGCDVIILQMPRRRFIFKSCRIESENATITS